MGRVIRKLSINTVGQKKWVRASARKKAFGSRLRQAKRSACPHPRVGKIALLNLLLVTATGAPPHGGEMRQFIFPACSFVPRKEPRMGKALSPKRGNSAPNPATIRREGQGLCPSRDRGTQRPTGGHAGLSCPRRRFATRWRSAVNSNSSSWRS